MTGASLAQAALPTHDIDLCGKDSNIEADGQARLSR